MTDGCYLFVSCPFGGTEVFMKNLRSYVDSRQEIDARWLEIPRLPVAPGGIFGAVKENWTLRASMSTFSTARKLQKNGTPITAAFFNHLTALTMFPWRRRIPCILSLDTTPVLLNLDRGWYRPERFQTRGVAEQLSHAWTRRTYAAMRYLLPWSRFAQDSLVSDYGIESERIMVLPPGIDLSIWKPGEDSLRRQRSSFSVLFVGGDFVRKGGDTLLRVAQDEAFRDMEFHFVTKSFSGPTPVNVHVHTDIQPNSDTLMNLYRNSDVFVLPTKADYAPTNAVIEALSMGIPVITSDVGGLGDLIENGKQGFVIPVNDSEALGRQLRNLRSAPPLLRELRSNARRFAEMNFDITKSGSTIIDLLQKVSTTNTVER